MHVDERVIRRLETTAATAMVLLAESMKMIDPSGAADSIPFRGGALIATGPGRYVNRAVGLTIDELSSTDLEVVEAFYEQRGLSPAIELSSWAPTATTGRLAERHYTPSSFRSMFVRPVTDEPDGPSADIRIEPVTDELVLGWLDVLAEGNEIDDPSSRAISDEFGIASRVMPDTTVFVAIVDGVVAGCGSVQVVGGVGWVGAAATLPSHRSRGIQTALLHHRLQMVAEMGCDLAAATAVPSGVSARNLQRAGFVHAQTQVVLVRP